MVSTAAGTIATPPQYLRAPLELRHPAPERSEDLPLRASSHRHSAKKEVKAYGKACRLPHSAFCLSSKATSPDGSVDPSGEVALLRYEIIRLTAHKGV